MSRLDEIETFLKIAHSGSISRAAAVLKIAKSAASRRLADLESRLGAQLFHRTTRRLSLTDAGAAFLEKAERILGDLEEAEAEVSEGHNALSGVLRVAAPLSFGLSELRCVIAGFACAHPKVIMDVDFSDRRVDLVGEGFDVAVRIGELQDSSLIARRLCPSHMVAVASPAYWEENGRPRHPRDLEALCCLRYSNLERPGVIPYWGPGGESGSITPPIRMLANNGDFLADVAAHGGGFLIEPTFLLYKHLRAGTLESVLTDYAWSHSHIHVVYPPARQRSARVRAFADAVIEKFRNNPYWDEGLNLSSHP